MHIPTETEVHRPVIRVVVERNAGASWCRRYGGRNQGCCFVGRKRETAIFNRPDIVPVTNVGCYRGVSIARGVYSDGRYVDPGTAVLRSRNAVAIFDSGVVGPAEGDALQIQRRRREIGRGGG